MPKSRNSYNKGLNQDASRSKYDPANYYDALNLRVVTHDGLSTGSVENEKGNALTFGIPDLPATFYTHSDGTVTNVPAQTNLKIIGWTAVSNYVVIFTTNETTSNPLNSVGQVWKLQYDEATNTIVGIGGGLGNPQLTITNHLVYNGYLNFSSYNRIEAEGRFENSAKVRVYFTDFYNPLRTIDILDPDVINLKADVIDIKPNITFSPPTVVGIGIGSLAHASKVQYAYRLISSQGAQTIVSPTTPLVTLISQDTNSETNYIDIIGNTPDSGTSKSVTFNIKELDQDFAVIEHLAVLYTTKDAPQIFKFGEEAVPASGEITVTLDGSETRIQLTQAEFSLISSGFDTCKTIDAKDNVLVAGNIKTTPAEVSTTLWDARAYRFNSSRIARIYNNTVPHDINGVNPDWLLGFGSNQSAGYIEHDAINPFNKETPDPAWTTGAQYKYQADGVTLGGEGPNVKYEFVMEQLEVDKKSAISQRRSPPHIEATRYPSGTLRGFGVKYPSGTDVTHDISGEYPNFASPIIESLFTGYARGEVYRFGIEFYKKKGNTTFVAWIGDIKFPEPADGFLIGNGTLDSGSMYVNSLGIRFTIDISAIANDIAGYRIVRAERTDNDITRLGTGTILIMNRRRDDDNQPSSNKIKNTLYESFVKPINGFDVEVGIDQVNWGGSNTDSRFHLPDQIGPDEGDYGTHQGVNLQYPSTKQNTVFLSPLTVVKDHINFGHKQGDYIKTLGYYRARAKSITNNTSQINNDDARSQQWVWVNRQWEAPTHGAENFFIEKILYPENGQRYTGTQIPDSISSGGDDWINISYGKSNGTVQLGYPFGIGDQIAYMILDNTPPTNYTPGSSMSWNSHPQVGNYTVPIHGALHYTTNIYKGKEVAYVRPLAEQYGGDSYAARSKQQYISTGHFQVVTPNVPTTLAFNVYGGDVTVSYWDREYIQPYLNQTAQDTQGKLDAPNDCNLSVATLFPCESRINMEYSWGRTWAKNRDGEDVGQYVNESYNHDEFYLQQNNSEGKFFAKDFTSVFSEEFPHRLWASDTKVDGELIDSWRSFKTNNILDVEGSYGPINKVINFQDKLFYYQDRAFGIASINERSVISDNNGIELTLGTGDVLDDYRYISTTTGTVHQFSVVASTGSLYHYDVNLRKMYRFGTGGTVPLTDIKGLSAFFANNVDNSIVDNDITLRDNTLGGPIGIHGVFDYRHNRLLMTFLNPKPGVADFTIGFNEFLQAYESFYSFTPGIYLNTGRRLLSVDKNDQSQAYLHDEGDYGVFYGSAAAPTEITLMVSPDGDVPKIFTNLEYNSEVSLANVQQPLETLTGLEIFNDYQTTGVIPLIVGTNIKRRIRHWRHVIGRDALSATQRARIRDYSIFLKLSYANNNDKRLVLHDIIVSYTPARD